MARPTKLNEQVAEIIITLIEGGVPDKHAARAAGIHPATLIDWKHRGENESTDPIDPDDYTKKALTEIADDREVDLTGCKTKADIADRINEHVSPFAEFYERLRAAESRFLAEGIGQIRKLGKENSDWRAFAFLIERRFPEIFGRRRDDQSDLETTGGTSEDADRMLGRAKEIRVKMIEAG